MSLQGEGVRAGTVNVFIRLSGCNLRCSGEVVEGTLQPVCDTEFVSGRRITLEEMAIWAGKAIQVAVPSSGNLQESVYPEGLRSTSVWKEPWIIVTGGEPALQVDKEFCDFWHNRGVKIAIETNGTIELPYIIVGNSEKKLYYLDWITVSPKTAEHTIKQARATEVKYVRGYGQGIPKPTCKAEYYLLSPHFEGDQVHSETLKWCQRLCLENPQWRLSVQQHKAWRMR